MYPETERRIGLRCIDSETVIAALSDKIRELELINRSQAREIDRLSAHHNGYTDALSDHLKEDVTV